MADDSQSATLSRGLAVATPARVRILLALVLVAVFVAPQLKTETTPQDTVSLTWEHDGAFTFSFSLIVLIATELSRGSKHSPGSRSTYTTFRQWRARNCSRSPKSLESLIRNSAFPCSYSAAAT
jgi:hypothetical protein